MNHETDSRDVRGDARRFLAPGISVLLGVPLAWWGLAGMAAITSDESPKPGPNPALAGAVVVLALALLVAVAGRRWRVVQSLAVLLMTPWLVLGLLLVWAFGLGLVLVVLGLVWLPALVSASRARRSEVHPAVGAIVAA